MILLAFAAYCAFCKRWTDHDDNAGCKVCGR